MIEFVHGVVIGLALVAGMTAAYVYGFKTGLRTMKEGLTKEIAELQRMRRELLFAKGIATISAKKGGRA